MDRDGLPGRAALGLRRWSDSMSDDLSRTATSPCQPDPPRVRHERRGGEDEGVTTVAEGVFGRQSAHEQVVFCQDRASGLKAIIGIYSTALGPALGGTRFYPYESESAALDDVLALSKGMAYKNALAGLDLGGGKAVIIGDPATDKTEALLRAYGRFIQSMSGRYI